jgi:protein-tyrosine phosphatase
MFSKKCQLLKRAAKLYYITIKVEVISKINKNKEIGGYKMIHILFVCLGNICRSPMAEAIFREQVKREGLEERIVVDSAGTGDWHIGKPPHDGTRKILKANKISDEGIVSRQIKASDLNDFDYIIAMDTENVKNIRKLASSSSTVKIKRLLDFVDDNEKNDVPDPYYTGNFDEVYQLIQEGCERLVQEIKKDLLEKEK